MNQDEYKCPPSWMLLRIVAWWIQHFVFKRKKQDVHIYPLRFEQKRFLWWRTFQETDHFLSVCPVNFMKKTRKPFHPLYWVKTITKHRGENMFKEVLNSIMTTSNSSAFINLKSETNRPKARCTELERKEIKRNCKSTEQGLATNKVAHY